MAKHSKPFADVFFLVETWFPEAHVINEASADDARFASLQAIATSICDCEVDQPICAIWKVETRAGKVLDVTDRVADLVEMELRRRYEKQSVEDYSPEVAIDLVNKFRKTDIMIEIEAAEREEIAEAVQYDRDRRLLPAELI